MSRPSGLQPPKGKGKAKPKKPRHPETEAHAREVKAVIGGKDIVDRPEGRREQATPLAAPDLLVVRAWFDKRPLEPTAPASALVHFPRGWNTRRGRYCRFVAPGAGSYGLVRARPTF